jgi:hypothetical protein
MKIFCAHPVSQEDWFFSTLAALRDRGHSFPHDVGSADIVFFEARYGPHAFDDAGLRIAISRRLPTVIFDFHDYPSYGSELKPQWLSWAAENFSRLNSDLSLRWQPWAGWVQTFFQHEMVRAYFMPNVSKSYTYPDWVHPISYTWSPEWIQPEDSYDQFKNRPFDMCFIGMTSPPRATALCGLIEANFNVSWEWYVVRHPWREWIDKHRSAKLFIEADGNSVPNRPMQLAWVAPMLKQNSDCRWVHDWEHGKDCVRFGDFRGNLTGADTGEILRYLSCPKELYEIYQAGRETLREHFSREARANYVADVIEKIGAA